MTKRAFSVPTDPPAPSSPPTAKAARRGRRWRTAAAATALAALAATVTACGSGGPGSGGSGRLVVWGLQDTALNPVQKKEFSAYDKQTKGAQATFQTFVNDPYKQKLQTALGSPNAPDVFLNWGGGNLATYVTAKQVADLTPDLDASFRDKFLPSVLDGGKVHGRYYAVPMQGVQPVAMYYNKDVLAKAGVKSAPATWSQLLDAVDRMKAVGVTPIALAGSQSWTELMWMEYLLDRTGGPKAFRAVQENEPGAWKDPAVKKSLDMIRQLVDRGAFGSNYASVGQDNGGADALLAKGRAGMHLMGSWEYAGQLATAPDFVKGGKLGWSAFPSVPGGKGDPKDVVGNPSNFFSVTAGSKDRKDAVDFVKKTVTDKAYVKDLIDIGQVPALDGIDAQIKAGENADYNTFVYDMVKDAPSFTQSWDQALAPAVAQKMLTDLQQVFNKQMSPKQFVDAMDAA